MGKDNRIINTEELISLLSKHLRTPSNEKVIRKMCEEASKFQPHLRRIFQKNLVCGKDFPSTLEILSVLSARGLEEHPDAYPSIRTRQMNERLGIGMQWDNACKYGLPLARIDPDAFRMILDCQAPKNTPFWKEQTTPKFPSQYYILPKGMLQVENEPVNMLGISIMTEEELHLQMQEISRRADQRLIDMVETGAGMFLAVAFTRSGQEYYTRQPIFDGLIVEHTKFHDHSGQGASTSEIDFSAKLLSIGTQILLLENSYPEWNSPEELKHTVSGSGRRIPEFRPRMIGGKFPHRRKPTGTKSEESNETLEEDRKKPCEHWKGSHWKTVRHGKANSLSKTKLILPYIVNPGIE